MCCAVSSPRAKARLGGEREPPGAPKDFLLGFSLELQTKSAECSLPAPIPSESWARIVRLPPEGAGSLQEPQGRDLAAIPLLSEVGETWDRVELPGTSLRSAPWNHERS